MVDLNKAIDFMYQLQRKGTKYSMYGSRIGTDGTADCSGAVYQALRNGGLPSAGYVLSTETLHSWLLKNGFKLVAENRSWNAKRGDVTIWGKRGQSAGAGGHVGIWIDGNNWIECTAWRNGVITYNHDQRWAMAGRPYFYTYRYAGSTPASKPSKPTNKTVKVKRSATAWSKSSGGAKIPDWVKGGTFELAEKRNYRQSRSTAEYVIKNKGVVLGAILAQDIEGATEVVKSTPKPQSSGIKWYAERGTFTANETINVRDKPSTKGNVVAQYKKGQSVIYDKFCHNGGYVWLSYMSNSGHRRYMVAGRSNGRKRTSSFGTFK